MNTKKILNSYLGKKLIKAKIQSCVIEGEMSNLINVTFLYFGEWVRIASTDEITTISVLDDSFDKITHYGDNFFYYPINPLEFHFPDIKNYYGKKLINWKELVFHNNEHCSYGINLYFEDNLNFIIHNQAYPIDANQYIFTNSLPINLIEK